jgi:hypothetical protein
VLFVLIGASLCLSAAAPPIQTPLSEPLEAAGYSLSGSKRGVRVFTRPSAEDIHIAGEAELPAPPAKVREVLLDYDRHAGRVPRVAESRVLTRGPGAMVVYQRLALPVVSDRDFTLRVRWGRDKDVLWIAYDAVRAGPPPVDGVVRVYRNSGSWQLRPVREGSASFVRYQGRIDLAGSIPKWLSRSRAGNDIPGLFGAICRMLAAGPCR